MGRCCTPQLTLNDGNYVLTVKSELQRQVGATSANVAHQTIKLKSGATRRPRRGTDSSRSPSLDRRCHADDLGPDAERRRRGRPDVPRERQLAHRGHGDHIGPGDLPEKPPQSLNKFLVAHEHGHQVQARSFPVGGGNYDEVIDENVLCRCDQVTQSNQLHCMQSLEVYTSAFTEGPDRLSAAEIDAVFTAANAYPGR